MCWVHPQWLSHSATEPETFSLAVLQQVPSLTSLLQGIAANAFDLYVFLMLIEPLLDFIFHLETLDETFGFTAVIKLF